MLAQANRRTLVRNAILASLDLSDLNSIAEYFEPVTLPERMIIQEPRKAVDYVYFIESGLVSVRIVAAGTLLETALIGPRGAVNASFLLGCHVPTYQSVVVLGGSALRIRVADLRRVMGERLDVYEKLLRFVEAFKIHGAQNALCGVRHDLEQRLASWLCLACDEIVSQVIPVTHDYLSSVLGLRRPGVTEALSRFEDLGLLSKTRGVLKVDDRAQLETKACKCYRLIASVYALPSIGISGISAQEVR